MSADGQGTPVWQASKQPRRGTVGDGVRRSKSPSATHMSHFLPLVILNDIRLTLNQVTYHITVEKTNGRISLRVKLHFLTYSIY